MNNYQQNANSYVFLWDLHEVILEKNIYNWLTLCLTFKRKWELIKKLDRKSITILTTFILERLKITKKQMVSEELIQAAHSTGNDALIQLITDVCSAYVPIKETVAIINELSALGYKHHLGSNIGQTVYDNCLIKFPTIFNLFEHYSIPFNNSKAEIIKKPNPHFFTSHLEKCNIPANTIIFIDDKLINIQAAQSVGMHAIQFKNPHQLREQLIKHAILKG